MGMGMGMDANYISSDDEDDGLEWRVDKHGPLHGQLERAIEGFGFRALLSSPWYLDLHDSWDTMYRAQIVPESSSSSTSMEMSNEAIAGLLAEATGENERGGGGRPVHG